MSAETVSEIHRWLFGDDMLYVAGTEMRLKASLRILENPGLREVHVPHPKTGELVLVTRKEILEHGEDDHRVLEAAQRYNEAQMRWHGRLIRALQPYDDGSMSVGDALRRAAVDLGIEADGRGFEAVAEVVVVVAAEGRGVAPTG